MSALPSLLHTTISGGIFGLALLFSSAGFEDISPFVGSREGKSEYAVYTDRFYYLYLIILFLTASACSVAVIYVSNKAGWARLKPRSQASYGWFEYDGNIVGGILQGLGMALTMTEPGLVFVRAGMGEVDAWWLVLGGVLGGLGFVLVGENLKRTVRVRVSVGDVNVTNGPQTLQDVLGGSMESMVATYEIVVVCVVVLLTLYVREVGIGHESDLLTPVTGGVLLGLAQLMSVVLTGGTIGVSSAYPSFAVHVLRMLGDTRPDPGYGSIAFACGLVLSGALASMSTGILPVSYQAHSGLTREIAIFAGALMIFGSRLAGGCTSGHGVSGCGTLSISSFVTLTAILAGVGIWKIALA